MNVPVTTIYSLMCTFNELEGLTDEYSEEPMVAAAWEKNPEGGDRILAVVYKGESDGEVQTDFHLGEDLRVLQEWLESLPTKLPEVSS